MTQQYAYDLFADLLTKASISGNVYDQFDILCEPCLMLMFWQEQGITSTIANCNKADIEFLSFAELGDLLTKHSNQ